MRHSPSDLRLAIAALAIAACTPPVPESPRLEPTVTASAPPPPAAPPGAPRRKGRTLLAEPREGALPFTLSSIAGGRAALAVAQRGDERVAWVRRIDGATGAYGPLLRFAGSHVFGAFDRPDGSSTVVTSDGARLCFGIADRDRACVQDNPIAIVPVGDRLALLELTSVRPPEPARGPQKQAPAPPKHKPSKPAAKGAAKKKPAAHHAAPARKPSHPLVELFVRWVDANGAIDAEAKSTGLHFEAPLDGMTLADARGRAPGIDLLWFETAPKRKARSPLGSGRLMAGSLRADGSLDFASRVAVIDADLEYGSLKDHRAPRLTGDESASIYLGLDAKGQCEAMRVRPSLAHLAPPASACLVAPDRIAGALEAADLAFLDRVLADEPRRAFGQPRSDLGLAAWAGERAYYLRHGALRSSSRDGGARDEAPPFPTRRSHIAWGSLAADGEAMAFVDGAVVHVSVAGDIARAAVPANMKALASPELPVDRRRAARIGATWWLARGPRMRVWPEPSAPVATGHPDTAVLTGGADRGLVIELSAGALLLSSMDAAGTATGLGTPLPSPVRPGFDACERAGGGALVAGVSAADPGKLVVLAVDAAGHVSAPHPVPRPIRAGELGVRLVPLPAGGALLSDLDRRFVIWIDDDGEPHEQADWPLDESNVVCPDGRAMRLSIPAPAPGQLTRPAEVAEGACIVGDATWARDGSLRWLGGTMESLDFATELAALPLLPPVPVPVPVPVPASASTPAPAPARRCPPEMVSIAGRFCVDRFESSLADARTGEPLSPDYPVTPNLLDFALSEWSTARERTGSVHARAFPLPWISPSRLGDKPEPLAVSRLGVRPSGYLTGIVAEAACAAAGKRLCTLDEFVTACRGEDDTLFPYGDSYEDGVCNVYREEHPAALLHGNASIGHLDPRLDRVPSTRGRPLLQRTGESPACRSRWGDDAVYDMVGNLDEWVDEGGGAFAGGFFARSTRSGCEALVTAHPKSYLDYSTGARCCKDAG